MDKNLFIRLVANMLSVTVTMAEKKDLDFVLETFEAKYCYNKKLQSMFTKDALHYLFRASKADTFYEVIDPLNIAITFFEFENTMYIIGPYAKSEYSEEKIQSLLMQNGISDSVLYPIEHYYTSFPIIYTDQLRSIVSTCIQVLAETRIDFEYKLLSGFIDDSSISSDIYSEVEKNFSAIYRRYDAENRFLNMIRQGDIANVPAAYNAMAQRSAESNELKAMFVYYNPTTSFAMIRALARKAAEESGLSVIVIDNITQKYIQVASSVHDTGLLEKYMLQMISELTQAVHDHRLFNASYSQPVRNVIEYIQLHLSMNLNVDELAKKAGLSSPHLSKVFKAETGDTLMTYVAKERCKKAADLLIKTSLPIQEIGAYVGYQDNNYFVKVFKKIMGSTPSIYRTMS